MAQSTFLDFSFGKVSSIDHGIIFTEFYSNDKFNIEQARKIDSARFELCNGKAFFSLVSLKGAYGHMTKEAQYFFANESLCSNLIIHEAIIVNMLSVRLLVKYYIRFTKPQYGIEVVKDYQQGFEFLLNLTRDHDNHNQD